MIADTPRGLQAHQPGSNATVTTGKLHAETQRIASTGPLASSELNLDLRRNIYEPNGRDVTPAGTNEVDGEGAVNGARATEDALKEPKQKHFCNTCGADCTKSRYHYAKSTPLVSGKPPLASKFDICTTCFQEGRFPGSTSKEEYIAIEDDASAAILDREKPWSDAETLALLEALEMHDEDWAEIANYVGTRTREQCVLKFLQFPIEDKYLDAEQAVPGSNSLAYLAGGSVPFDRADNPILSVVGFLASAVDPSVAAAAAGRSVEEMRRTMRDRLEKPSAEETGAGEKAATPSQPLKLEDTMDVDTAPPTGAPATTTTSTSAGSPAVPTLASSTSLTQTQQKPSNPAATALALAAARATALASHEERHITSMLSTATNLQSQKLELKLQQFKEMEGLLAAERRDVERRRRELFLERLAWRRRVERCKGEVGRGMRLLLAPQQQASTAAGAGTGGAGNVEEALRVVADALQNLGLGSEALELKQHVAGMATAPVAVPSSAADAQAQPTSVNGAPPIPSSSSSAAAAPAGPAADASTTDASAAPTSATDDAGAAMAAMAVDPAAQRPTQQAQQQQQQRQAGEVDMPDARPFGEGDQGFRSYEI